MWSGAPATCGRTPREAEVSTCLDAVGQVLVFNEASILDRMWTRAQLIEPSPETGVNNILISLVPAPGLEPGLPFGAGILSPLRLPVPPSGLSKRGRVFGGAEPISGRLTGATLTGQMKPVADNTTPEGRRQNRRVEVKILVSRGIAQTN